MSEIVTQPHQPACQPSRCGGRREGGFVLITILFMAAVIAIGLAVTLPRAAMQAQRIREERLIYRGEQYKRAIELYYRVHKKYPSEIDDLEETNGVRFLRQRYKDPMNKNEEWRFIRMGSDGRFKDSLIHDIEDPEEQRMQAGMSGRQPAGGIGSSTPFRAYAGNYQTPYVPPDGRFRGADRARNIRESAAPEQLGRNEQRGWIPGQTPPPGTQPQVDENGNPIPPQNAEGEDPNRPQQAQYPGTSRMRPGQTAPNQPAYPGATYGNQRNRNARGPNQIGGMPAGIGGVTAPGARGAFNAAAGAMGIGGQAADVIRNILTSPRPGGLAGLQSNRRAQGQRSAFTGGIAGVATKVEEMGVKVYEGREMYNEWEFVYDYRKDDRFGGAAGVGAGMGVGMAGPAGSLPAGQPGMTPSGTLGGMPGAVGTGAYPPGYPTGAVPPAGPQPGTGNNPYRNLRTGGPGIQPVPQPGFGVPPAQRGFGRQPPQPGITQPTPGGTPGISLPGTTPGIPQPGTTPMQPGTPGAQPGVIYGPDGTPLPRRRR